MGLWGVDLGPETGCRRDAATASGSSCTKSVLAYGKIRVRTTELDDADGRTATAAAALTAAAASAATTAYAAMSTQIKSSATGAAASTDPSGSADPTATARAAAADDHVEQIELRRAVDEPHAKGAAAAQTAQAAQAAAAT